MATMTNEHTISSAHLSPIDLLGTRVDGTFTAEQAMTEGLLGGWDVRKAPLQTVVDGKTLAIPGMNAVVRNNPTKKGQVDVLSRHGVSDSYSIVQNEQHAGFLNALVDESGANFELAGAIDGGRKVFISMKLPGHINVGGVDPVDLSLLAINSHDGSMSFTLAVLPVRYACSNVLNSVFGGMSGLVRIRHTSGAQKQMVAQAREALDLSFKYLDHFQEEAERLINTTMTQSMFEQIIEAEFGPAEDASQSAVTRAERKIEEITGLFAEAQTQDGIRDTAWAGYNALTEWNDHFAPTRGEDRDASRAQKAILDPAFKNQALRLMLAHA
jgi:phage/plasmid-like protein (TIGR03299 family)